MPTQPEIKLSRAQHRALFLLGSMSPPLAWVDNGRGGIGRATARVLADKGLAEVEIGLWDTWRCRATPAGHQYVQERARSRRE